MYTKVVKDTKVDKIPDAAEWKVANIQTGKFDTITGYVNVMYLESYTLLRHISWKNYQDAKNFLNINDVNVNSRDAFSLTSLFYASRFGNEEIVTLLLKKGAKVDLACDANSTPLIQASKKGHVGVVRILLENKADWKHKDDNGKTALDHAIEGKHTDVINLLNDAAANKESESKANSDGKAKSESKDNSDGKNKSESKDNSDGSTNTVKSGKSDSTNTDKSGSPGSTNTVKSGKGKMTYANGDIYEGDWKDGNISGKGKMTYANKDIYEGDWKDGKMSGKGKMSKTVDGKQIVVEGNFENGSFIPDKSFFQKISSNYIDPVKNSIGDKVKLVQEKVGDNNLKIAGVGAALGAAYLGYKWLNKGKSSSNTKDSGSSSKRNKNRRYTKNKRKDNRSTRKRKRSRKVSR